MSYSPLQLAQALLELTPTKETGLRYHQELEAVLFALKDNVVFRTVVFNPLSSRKTKRDFMVKVVVHEAVQEFCLFVSQHLSAEKYMEFFKLYQRMLCRKYEIPEIEIFSSSPLSSRLRKNIIRTVSQQIDSPILLQETIDTNVGDVMNLRVNEEIFIYQVPTMTDIFQEQ